MGLFKKSKMNSSCCNIQIEEVKNDNDSKATSECCDVKIEEAKPDSTNKNKQSKCCN